MVAAVAGCSSGKTAKEEASEGADGSSNPTASTADTSAGAQEDPAEEPAPMGPKIRFDQPDYDFGQIEAGEDVEHIFVFHNTGDELLSVEEVLTSCGCTGTLVSEEAIPPGGTGEIQATFHAKGFQGKVKKGLTVVTNDPEHELVRLTIGGKVVSEVSVEPGYLNWGTIQPGDAPRPRKLSIRLLEGRDVRLEEVRSESPSVVLTKESENGRKVVYSAALAEDLPAGRFTGRVTIRSNSERVPEIHVPFQGQVQGNVKVIPHILSLGKVKPGKALTRRLRVYKTGKQGVTVQEIKTTSEALGTEVREEKKGAHYLIDVTYTPGIEEEGPIAERITIIVNDGEDRFLEVPVYGRFDTGGTETPSS
jgi:hypothetical protein